MARLRNSAPSSKDSEIDKTLAEVRKRFGGAAMTYASDTEQPDRISTGVFTLDLCLLGGVPTSRVSMVVGERHAGKSLLAALIAGNAQKKYPDRSVVYIDVEGTYDTVWGSKLGVDNSQMYLFKPETGEAVVDVADAFVHTKETSLIIIDSIAALTPFKEIESSAEDALVGLQARLVGGLIRKVTSGMIKERLRGHEVTVLFVNQYRAKIGGFSPFGEPKSIPGGKALEFSTSVQIVIKNKEEKGKSEIGTDIIAVNEHSFTVTKNKLNGGGRSGEFMLRRIYDDNTGLGEGEIDDAATVLAFAKKFGIYTGGGQSWSLEFWDFAHKFKNTNEAILFLYENRDHFAALKQCLLSMQAQQLNMPEYFIERFYV